MYNLYGIILLLTLGGLLVLIYRSFKQSGGADKSILQDELQKNRMELTQSLQLNREELSKNLDRLSEKLEERLRYINENQVWLLLINLLDDPDTVIDKAKTVSPNGKVIL